MDLLWRHERLTLAEAHEAFGADRIGYTSVSLEAAIHLAHLSLLAGDPEQALEQLDRAVAGAGEEAEEFTLLESRIRAAALMASGKADDARVLLEASIAEAQERQHHYELARLHEAKAEAIADEHDAAAHRSFAAEFCDRLGIRM